MKTNYFDHYGFRARLQPAFLALAPVAVGVMAWAQPGAKWVTALWSLLGAAGFTFFLANRGAARQRLNSSGIAERQILSSEDAGIGNSQSWLADQCRHR
jgi:hypothetical protein